jgi:hypothetical protein
MDVEKVFLDQIAALEKQIADLRAALQAVQESKRKLGDPKMIFFDARPIDAIRVVLGEHGGRLKRAQLVDELVNGGLVRGKKRGLINIRTSIDLNIANGNLVQEGEYLELPKE